MKKTRIAERDDEPLHAEAAAYFNRLILDLKLDIEGHPMSEGITMERLNQGTKHLRDLDQCRRKVRFYRGG